MAVSLRWGGGHAACYVPGPMGHCPSRRALLLLGALLVGACYAPTLPLPPPVEPDVSGPTETGTYYLEGNVTPNAHVIALNERTNLSAGQQTGSDGHYGFEIAAEAGDPIVLWYVVGVDQSPPVAFDIPE
jgi:hypothetical protein